MVMYVYCGECGRVIGKVIFDWFESPGFEIYDLGMLLYPNESICQDCVYLQNW
jgi:hypothetical protein